MNQRKSFRIQFLLEKDSSGKIILITCDSFLLILWWCLLKITYVLFLVWLLKCILCIFFQLSHIYPPPHSNLFNTSILKLSKGSHGRSSLKVIHLRDILTFPRTVEKRECVVQGTTARQIRNQFRVLYTIRSMFNKCYS